MTPRPTTPADDEATRFIAPTPAQQRATSEASQTRPSGDWHPPSPEELSKLLPQYDIDAMIGRGGMGAVYRGKQTSLDRSVAIKLLPSEMAADAEFVGRFQREARTLAKLQHPGIVAVYDFGQTSEGHLYFVMEYVNGVDLACVIYGDGLNPVQALDLCSQICDALHYAHDMGVMHRDIKPANVLLTKSGKAKLADFGLARPMAEDHTSGFTRTNTVMGTPDYMAPEQLLGMADHRADLYAVGVMLYEMLTKQKPRGAWEPPSRKANVDPQLDQVVVKALQYEREKRYQNANEMKTAVEVVKARTERGEQGKTVLGSTPVGAPGAVVPELHAKKHTSWTPLVAAILLIAAAGGGFFVWQKMQPPPPAPVVEPPKPVGVPKEMARNFATKRGNVPMVFDAATETWASDPGSFDPARDGSPDEWTSMVTAIEQNNGKIPKHYHFEVAEEGVIKVTLGAPKFMVGFPATAVAPVGNKPGTIVSPVNGKPVSIQAKDWRPGTKVADAGGQAFLLPEELPKLVASLSSVKAPAGTADGSAASPFSGKVIAIPLKDYAPGLTLKCPDTGLEFSLPNDIPRPIATLDGAVTPTPATPGSVMSPYAGKPVPVPAADWHQDTKLICPVSGREFLLPVGLPLITASAEGAVALKTGAPGSVLSPFTKKPVAIEAKNWKAKTQVQDPEAKLDFILPDDLPPAVATAEGATAPKGTEPGSVKSPFTGNPVPVVIASWQSGTKLQDPETKLDFLMPADALPKPIASMTDAVKPKGTKPGSVLSPITAQPVEVERSNWHPGATIADADKKEFVLPDDVPMLTASTSGAKAPIGTKSGSIVSPYSGDDLKVEKSKWKEGVTIHCPKADFDFLMPDDLPPAKEEEAPPAMTKVESPVPTSKNTPKSSGSGNIPPQLAKTFVTIQGSIIMKFDAASSTWSSGPKAYLPGGSSPEQFARDMTARESGRGRVPRGYQFTVNSDGSLTLGPK